MPKSPYVVKGHYQLEKLSDIIHSRHPLYAAHKDWQNRIGEDKLAEASLQQIKNDFYWRAYGDSAFTDTGAPIVIMAPDAEGTIRPFVVSGNGRVMVLLSLLESHMYDKYRDGLREMAAEMGIEIPSDGSEYALVRVMDDLDGVSIDDFVTKSNGDNKRKVGDAARAKQDAAAIVANGLAALYHANVDGTPDMTPGVNDEFFRRFSQLATDGDAIYDEGFNVVEEGRNRVLRALLFVSAGQGDRGPATVDKVIRMTDTLGVRRQRNAMECCAAPVAALEANPDYAIGPDVSRAMADYMDFVEKKKSGVVGTFADFMAEQDMFDPRSEIAEGVLQLLASSRNAREIADVVNRYCDIAAKSDVDGSLQGASAARSREDVWREAVKAADAARAEKAAQRQAGGEDGTARLSVTVNPDMSRAENAKAFREYLAAIPAKEMPERLTDGRPRAALEWFEKNLVGRTFAFDIPGIGKREFRVNEGHLFRLVCDSTGGTVRKGFVAKAKNAEDARRMMRNGEVDSSDVAGWNESRARSLPLVPEVLTGFDALMRERDRPGFLVFLKKFVSKSGRVNTVVMRLNEDGITLGPMSAHVKDLTDSWLKKQDLTVTSDGKVFSTRSDNSATGHVDPGDNAERNSPENTRIISNSSVGDNGGNAEKRARSSSRLDATLDAAFPGIDARRRAAAHARFSVAARTPFAVTGDDLKRAVSRFGTTDDFDKAIYFMPDGTLLKGKGSVYSFGGRRIESFGHDGFVDLLLEKAPPVDGDGPNALAERGGQIEAAQRGIAAAGAIRISGEKNGLTISREPTPEQYDALWDLADQAYQVMESNGDDTMLVDVTDEKLATLFTLSYRRGTSARRIIEDLRGWYERGERPSQGAARYSIAGRKGAENMGIKGAAEAEAMEKAGLGREEIWRKTGWWRGRDGKWRVEIPDVKRDAWHGDPEERHFTGGGEDF